MSVQNFQGALRLYLLSDPTLAGLIGSRIYGVAVPQNSALPYVVLQKISTTPINNLSAFDDVIIERWQIDAYGETIDSAEAVAKAVFDKMHMKNHETWSGYKLYSAKFDNQNYMPEPKGDGSESVYHRIQQDFLIKHGYETL